MKTWLSYTSPTFLNTTKCDEQNFKISTVKHLNDNISKVCQKVLFSKIEPENARLKIYGVKKLYKALKIYKYAKCVLTGQKYFLKLDEKVKGWPKRCCSNCLLQSINP